MTNVHFGVLDNRFLSRSVGLLNPCPPLILGRQASVYQAITLLKENKVGCVVVTEEDDSICGIFTERDVVLRYCLEDLPPKDTAVESLMTKNPHVETMTTTMAFALQLMSHGGYRHLPIVDEDNTPVGIISVKDIVDYVVQELVHELERFKVD